MMAIIARFVRRRILLEECVEVKIGQDDCRNIPRSAARVRLTVSGARTVQTFVRPAL